MMTANTYENLLEMRYATLAEGTSSQWRLNSGAGMSPARPSSKHTNYPANSCDAGVSVVDFQGMVDYAKQSTKK
jgi:hypothetical protein